MAKIRQQPNLKTKKCISSSPENCLKVDLTDEMPVHKEVDSAQPEQVWLKTNSFTLKETYKELITSGAWLNDKIINSAQKLLTQQFQEKFMGAGFQDVLFGQLL